jgi:hypothetical protein
VEAPSIVGPGWHDHGAHGLVGAVLRPAIDATLVQDPTLLAAARDNPFHSIPCWPPCCVRGVDGLGLGEMVGDEGAAGAVPEDGEVVAGAGGGDEE